eukprot:3751245-Amphidinium_carterae.2
MGKESYRQQAGQETEDQEPSMLLTCGNTEETRATPFHQKTNSSKPYSKIELNFRRGRGTDSSELPASEGTRHAPCHPLKPS